MTFVTVVAVTLVAGGGYVVHAALKGGATAVNAGAVSALQEKPHVVFQDVRGRAGDRVYAHAGLAAIDDPGGSRVTTGLTCERVHFAAGRGLCLISRPNVVGGNSYEVTLTGDDFEPKHEVDVAGIPIRARVSPDGRYGATTGFVVGHSYADKTFSTKTVLVDMEWESVVADLEKDFTVSRDGKPFKRVDFNFWGVTFARQSGRFYATLGTGGKTYLLEGNVQSRRAKVLKGNVECPSISPDNTRLAYKSKEGRGWRLHVLDLATMRDTPLAEKRPVDDQVEWLDDEHILYGLSPDIWVVSAGGGGSPRKFLSKALSPAVVRN